MSQNSERDCYESPDVINPSGILKDIRNPDIPDNSDIDNSSLSSSELFKKFTNSKLDTSKQNYDHINIGKPLRQYEYSINPNARNSESSLERYQRLRAEIELL